MKSGGSAESSNFAYIFDFDGVLFYTMEFHYRCYKQVLQEYGIPIDRRQFYSQAGMKGVEQIAYFAKLAGVSVDPSEVYRRKREIQGACEVTAEPIACNISLLKLLMKNGNPVAIASGASKESIRPILHCHDLSIDVLVTSEDVERGKPHPDLFQEASRRMNVPPSRCIVIEDSDAGVEAALAAGMGVLRYFDAEKQKEPSA